MELFNRPTRQGREFFRMKADGWTRPHYCQSVTLSYHDLLKSSMAGIPTLSWKGAINCTYSLTVLYEFTKLLTATDFDRRISVDCYNPM